MFKSKVYNILIIISFLILLGIISYSSYDYFKGRHNQIRKDNEVKEECKRGDFESQEHEEFCKKILKEEEKPEEFFMTFANIVIFGSAYNGIGLQSFASVIILFIIIPVIYFVSRYFKSGIINYDLTRESFKKSKFRLFLNAYKPIIILPLIIIIAVLISYLYAPNFNGEYSSINGFIPWSSTSVSNPFIFILLYVINIFIHSILYVNIALLILRKYHNFFAATILSYLCFLALEIFLEVGLGGILFTSILNMPDKMIMFNIMNMFAFNDTNGILSSILIPLVLMIISFILVHLVYKNKERLIVDCTRNDSSEVVK